MYPVLAAASQQVGGRSQRCMIALPSPMEAHHIGLACPFLGLAATASGSVRIGGRAFLHPNADGKKDETISAQGDRERFMARVAMAPLQRGSA